jgi:hypothetical protein
VLVPGGRTGRLHLIDPKTRAVESVGGFTVSKSSGSGHAAGTTSADVGLGFAFASDRDKRTVIAVDLTTKKAADQAKLAGNPDYVRWVEPTSEVWVTEPNLKAIEFFHFERTPPKLTAAGSLNIEGGPESLVVDATRGRAYTHTWHDATVVVDLRSHTEIVRWTNGCEGSRGIALDEKRAWLFVGCDEGKVVTLDLESNGKKVGEARTGKGVDIVAYAPRLAHLFAPGGDDATLTVLGVGTAGQLTRLGTFSTAADAHCVAADDLGNAYVCDPRKGRLLVLHDPFPSSEGARSRDWPAGDYPTKSLGRDDLRDQGE